MIRAILGSAALAAGALFTTGCGPEPIQYDEQTIKAADQFRKVAVAYNQAAQRKRGPISADDLKSFLKEHKEHGDPETLLVSPLDGKSIVIVPGVTPGMEPGDDERMIVAYEQAGVNGQRMTVDIRGTVALVSDKDFAKIKFVGGHTPAGR
jgi:hypothetical protein